MDTVRMKISGMSCGHCVGAVRNALSKVKGVEVDDVIIGSATVRIDPAAVTIEALRDAVEDTGYEVVEAA